MKDPLQSDIFSLGQILNNTYEIIRVLGRGGTGEVYLARNQVVERDVAIKALNARFSGKSDYVELMKREEQMRNIIHDAVVRYSECSRSDTGQVFLVMDYIEGPSLNQVMLERRLDDRALMIVAHRVLEGLVATHDRGIVHRDLSPDNIILRNGRPEKAPSSISASPRTPRRVPARLSATISPANTNMPRPNSWTVRRIAAPISMRLAPRCLQPCASRCPRSAPAPERSFGSSATGWTHPGSTRR